VLAQRPACAHACMRAAACRHVGGACCVACAAAV
jgi:hypothetical protein